MDACGKAILNGEHFVVHGAPAVAVPLPAVRLRLVPGGRCTDPRVVEAWRSCCALLGWPAVEEAAPFTIESDLPLGAGVGSSAALGVAMVRLLAARQGRTLPAEEVADLGRRIEDRFHRPSSGLDPAVVAFERPLRWRPPASPRCLRWPWAHLEVLVAVAPGTRTTAEAVERVRSFAGNHPERFRALARRSEVLTDEWVRAMETGTDPDGSWMEEAHGFLREMGLSGPAIERIVEEALRAGALGAKISGAGIAGAVVVLAPRDRISGIRDAVLRVGATEVLSAGLAQ